MENWKFGYILHQSWSIINRFNFVSFSHALREGNRVANILSNLGCDLQGSYLLVREFDATLFPNLFKEIDQDSISTS